MRGFGEVGEILRKSTVHVLSGRESGGSGVIWNPEGGIITNAHVARGKQMEVQLWDGRRFPARLERRDPRADLASLRVEARGLPAAAVGDSKRLRPGELVIAVGNPLGFTGALSTGVVHGLGPVAGLGAGEWVQASVRLAPGNSGGPLADAQGNVIGINTMIVGGGLALAVPSHRVQRFLTAAPPVELGVVVRPVRIPAAASGIGLIVLGVEPGSPAERSSVQIGDVLTGADGVVFRSADDLGGVLERRTGGLLQLRFRRGDQRKEREVAVQLVRGVAA